MNKTNFKKNLATIPEVEPDEIDKQMMADSAIINDDTSMPLDTVMNEIEGNRG